MILFDCLTNIFHMGWFKHQLGMNDMDWWLPFNPGELSG